MIALLLCLPVWAMAAEYNLSQYTPILDEYNDIFLFGEGNEGSLADGDTITGTAAPCNIIQTGGVVNGATLYFDNVYVEDGIMFLSVDGNGSVTLVLQGNNYLASKLGPGLQVDGKLIITEGGSLGADSIYASNGCDIILPDYYGPVPAGKRFMQWSIKEKYGNSYRLYNKTAGESLTSNSQIWISPRFQDIPEDEMAPGTDNIPDDGMAPGSDNLPQTGDNSNVLLWSALACISLFGMMTLVRKREEA